MWLCMSQITARSAEAHEHTSTLTDPLKLLDDIYMTSCNHPAASLRKIFGLKVAAIIFTKQIYCALLTSATCDTKMNLRTGNFFLPYRGIKLDCFGSEERIAVIPSKGHFAWPFRRVRALVRNQLIIFSCFDNSTVLFLYRDREPNIVVAFGDEVPAECTSTIFGVYCNLQLVSGAVTGMIIEDIGKNVNL